MTNEQLNSSMKLLLPNRIAPDLTPHSARICSIDRMPGLKEHLVNGILHLPCSFLLTQNA